MDTDSRCEDCGETDHQVIFDTDCPYDEDVNGLITPVVICDDCYNNRCMEI